MPILPALRPLFDANMTPPKAAGPERPVAELRAGAHAMIAERYNAHYARRGAVAVEADHRVAVAGGQITMRTYRPATGSAPLPCHLYFHGGGFWLGTLDQSDPICRGLATDAECMVASVDYRLAPEHKFPTAPEDCYAALLWLVANADELGVDVHKISVGGASAGGNLAAVVCLMARDREGPELVSQILEIPVLDFTKAEPLTIPAEGVVVPSRKAGYRAYYLAEPMDADNPYASPLLAPYLHGLPPALIMCAEYDALRPEGEAYARRLAEAGVSIEFRMWEGQSHGSQYLAALIPEQVSSYQAQIVNMLRRSYAPSALYPDEAASVDLV